MTRQCSCRCDIYIVLFFVKNCTTLLPDINADYSATKKTLFRKDLPFNNFAVASYSSH